MSVSYPRNQEEINFYKAITSRRNKNGEIQEKN
jgi:hypothetical protein